MTLTRDFRETILKRVQRDRRFRQSLLRGAVDELLAGDVKAGKALLRDYINATITFDRLAAKMGKPSKSLQRMLGPKGNPTAANIFAMLAALQEAEQLRFSVRVAAAP